jgi:hypothetical protein
VIKNKRFILLRGEMIMDMQKYKEDHINFLHKRNQEQPCYVPDITAINNYRLTCINDPNNSEYRRLGLICYTPQKAMEIGNKMEDYARELGKTVGEED